MKVLVLRDPSGKVTLGKMYLTWTKVQPDIYTLELPWKNNEPHISCIPTGIYTLKPFHSDKHGNTWKFQNIMNRNNCELHPANFACDVFWNGKQHYSELEGCMAPGFGIDESIPMITRSQDAINYLRTTIGTNTTWEMEIRDLC